ncbi:ABC transporter ATP-binding protein [Hydrogenophaga palleronii]|uniref:ABC transporter ATP-binding protein n=1 Tax=Hydrogenophaga palleronii TaxID=65655 RepID=UPI0008257384|nr:ABC transporter ATP-binding protein [Hydrogenophaga palleronii]
MSFLKIEGLSAGYGKSVVLRGINLQVAEGEAIAVVGKNGAGKSTLLNTFFDGTTVLGGVISLGGISLLERPAYAAPKLGATLSPQGRMILPHLTVRENLMLGAASGRKGHWTLASVYALFPVLKERGDKPGTALSGGQQQMLAVGRALMGNPRILLLDEPSEGLSPLLVDELAGVLKNIRSEGTGLLLVEQHLSLVRRVCHRFSVMAKGAFIDHGLIGNIDGEQHRASLAF